MTRNHKQKPGRSTQSSWNTGIWIVMSLILFGEVLFYTWCRVQYMETGYAVTRAQEENLRLKALQKTLRIEMASLKSPERIARIAKEKLDLVVPGVDRMITIKP
jgi:cell division protein FtsL